MYNPRKRFVLFWINNKWKIIIGGIVLLLIVLTWWGLAQLESFYRNITIASIPLQILIGGIHAIIFVAMYSVFGMNFFSRTGKKDIKGSQVNIRFSDVIGIDEVKEEAWEVVQLIKDHAKLKRIGGKILKGILMVGPPGCGKTYLAKAIATEAGLPFISMSASEFVEVFVGVGASRMRNLFTKARNLAYGFGGCIIFIDELDAVGRNRSFGMFGTSETNNTLNQLLAEMDGLGQRTENVIVIGATNAPEDTMDPALLRPGRFDRKVYVTRPGLEGREGLFKYYLGKVKHEASIDVGHLARKAVGKSPAEIENIVKEAALIATRKNKDAISYKEISEAIERIELGIKVKRQMSDREKMMTAYHETGHLIITYLLHPTDDVFKASIIPRKSTLGVVHHQPREEMFSFDRDKLLADIKTALAGYAAEKVKFGVTTTGVSSDFTQAMNMAHHMVWRLGMGSSGMLGDFTAIPEAQLSDELKSRLNLETQKLIADCIKEVEDLLKSEHQIFERFSHELMVKEELEYDEIEAIFAEFGKANPRSARKVKYDMPEATRLAIEQAKKLASSKQDEKKN